MMLQSTQCGFYRAPDPAIFHKHGQPLSVVALSGQCPQHRVQLNCPLIWAILKPRCGEVTSHICDCMVR